MSKISAKPLTLFYSHYFIVTDLVFHYFRAVDQE